MSERAATWYDQFYEKARRSPKHAYCLDPEKCGYAPMWERAIGLIADDEGILDLGCGPGQFAQLALRQGKKYVLGVDFSPSAIAWAKARNPSHASAFRVGDFSRTAAWRQSQYDVVVLLEVLEHLRDDIGLLRSFAPGTRILLSVPGFMWKSHVRCFGSRQDVEKRYGDILTLRKPFVMPYGRSVIWLFNAVRKPSE